MTLFKSIQWRRAQICLTSVRTYYVKGVLTMLRLGANIVLRKSTFTFRFNVLIENVAIICSVRLSYSKI